MDFGTPAKLLYAKQVIAALGFIGLVNLDRVTVTGFADRPTARSAILAARSPRVRFRRLTACRIGFGLFSLRTQTA